MNWVKRRFFHFLRQDIMKYYNDWYWFLRVRFRYNDDCISFLWRNKIKNWGYWVWKIQLWPYLPTGEIFVTSCLFLRMTKVFHKLVFSLREERCSEENKLIPSESKFIPRGANYFLYDWTLFRLRSKSGCPLFIEKTPWLFPDHISFFPLQKMSSLNCHDLPLQPKDLCVLWLNGDAKQEGQDGSLALDRSPESKVVIV